jgi:cell division inhibitor SepF
MSSLESNRFDVASFEDVMSPANSYKNGFPTIVNLTTEEKDIGRRIVDFFSGLAFGTEGTFEKVAEGIYLITPSNASS